MISRFAPTPSGYLHWGNFLNFALTYALVRQRGGTLWLRIDDVDASRMRPEYVQDLFETLRWLGFEWERGPRTAEEFQREHSQHLRKEEYRAQLARVRTYACDCSRLQIQNRTSGPYDGFCRDRGLRFEPGVTALRMRLPGHPDTVVWTREDRPSYHWVSVHEDLRIGTTDLVRGEDLRETSALQQALAGALGEPGYDRIHHHFHRLLLGADGKKLSKSADSESLHACRAGGRSSKDAWRELSRRAGWDIEIPGAGELLALDLSAQWSEHGEELWRES